MPKDSMFYATLEEAIDAAREEFLANNPDSDEESANVEQLNIQKYVLQDGDIAWQAEFFADEEEQGECLPMLSGEAAQSVFDGDYDEIELRQEWLEENTLHEWDEGEFQLEPSAGHRRGADGSRRVGRALISYRGRGWRPEAAEAYQIPARTAGREW
ncbi:acidic protein msyB [Klebsiella pneumoniae]|uniref:Acidic protein msyB n=4 Tax=Gammaproteobacteria TaxID=1236 RepID=A0A2X3F7Q5_KLEPN|nr:acidic protein msyB [Klebsiella pneumoniae]